MTKFRTGFRSLAKGQQWLRKLGKQGSARLSHHLKCLGLMRQHTAGECRLGVGELGFQNQAMMVTSDRGIERPRENHCQGL